MHKTHVHTGDAAVPRYLLLPGDPGRVPAIAALWDERTDVSFNREFRYMRGTLDGVALGSCSTGIGAPSAEIALLELAAAGGETFIRVGQCGAVQPDIAVGTLVIQEGAVRLVGNVDAYTDSTYPAIADRDVTFALIEACEQLGLPYVVGLTASTDSFFAGQDNAFPVPLDLPAKVPFAEKMRSYGVATFEMEAAALFVLGRLIGKRCGSICSVESNRITGERRAVPEGVNQSIVAANRAVTILARWDALRAETGKRVLSESLLMSARERGR
jgi:uridine phosphorylase